MLQFKLSVFTKLINLVQEQHIHVYKINIATNRQNFTYIVMRENDSEN